MKIGLIYTGTTPELTETVEQEFRRQLGDSPELYSYRDPSILAEIRNAGRVTAVSAIKLIQLYLQAVKDGADVTLNLCSSVGEVVDSMQVMAEFLDVPIIRVDGEMCRQAVMMGSKIAVVATLPTTMAPTKNAILRAARESGKRVEVIDVLLDGAFGAEPEQFKAQMVSALRDAVKRADVILFAQGSMAYCEKYISQLYRKPVLSSPGFGVAEVKKALLKKGYLSN